MRGEPAPEATRDWVRLEELLVVRRRARDEHLAQRGIFLEDLRMPPDLY